MEDIHDWAEAVGVEGTNPKRDDERRVVEKKNGEHVGREGDTCSIGFGLLHLEDSVGVDGMVKTRHGTSL